jgi:hypothetical protein
MYQAILKWERLGLQWRKLAEQRRDHHLDLYKSGRWKHYYKAEDFLIEMGKAVAMADRWAVIAPLPGEREAPPKNEQPAELGQSAAA